MERENATLNLGKQGTRIAMGCQAKFPEPTPSSEVASAYTRRMDASYSHVVRNCISTKGNTEGVERETSLGTIHPGNVLRTTLPS